MRLLPGRIRTARENRSGDGVFERSGYRLRVKNMRRKQESRASVLINHIGRSTPRDSGVSQPGPDRFNLRLPGRINRPASNLGGCDDTQGAARSRSCDFTTNARPGDGSRADNRGRRRRSPARRAILALAAPRPPTSGTPTSSRSIPPSMTSPSPTPRSSVSIPDCCGPRRRPGARRAAIWCGAISPITGR
jgi:hypothetical protein